MPFKALGIIDPILKALHEEGYRTPTPIQQQAIPIVLDEQDLLGVAQTGTGKTAAFSVPILQLLSERPSRAKGSHRHIRCLILTPTRELAVQIADSLKAYGRHTSTTGTVIFGGVKQGAQTNALKRGVDIVVATPGRLLDLMDQGFVNLRHVEIFVLDEADRMLDMGFLRDVQDIIAELPMKRQSLFFSATMPQPIVKLASQILHDPRKVEIAPVTATADLIDQEVYFLEKSKKPQLLLETLSDPNIKHALVFTRTKHGADGVVRVLERNHIKADAIHGNKSQNARQRALDNFKSQRTRVLVATDIAARGIDIDELEYVINYEIPNVPEVYVHRIGRTGRAGSSGTAMSFCSPDEKGYWKDIEKLIGRKIEVVRDHPFAKQESTPAPTVNARGGQSRAPGERRDDNRGGRPQRGGPAAPRGGSAPHRGGGAPGKRGEGAQQRGDRDDMRSEPRSGQNSAPRKPATGPQRPASPGGRPAPSGARPPGAKKKTEHGRRRKSQHR